VKRRTLDFIFAGGGVLLAVLLLVLGLMMKDQYNFAKSYVKEELGAQQITFATELKDVAGLKDASGSPVNEGTWKAGSQCLVENKGLLMETGKQAECYAKYYIALHMRNSAYTAYTVPANAFANDTYATIGAKNTALKAVYDAALKDKGAADPATVEAKKQWDSGTGLRSTFQTGETLRGLLLTTYGFSIFGDKAGIVATICYIVAALLAVLSVAGFVHAFLTPPDKVVLAAGYAPKSQVPSDKRVLGSAK